MTPSSDSVAAELVVPLSRTADYHKISAAQLTRTYRRLSPAGAPTTMRRDLRAWLRAHESVSQETLDTFVHRQALGLRVTLSALADDPASQPLLAPELLLALQALDVAPDRLRREWPSDLRDLDLLADAFGRPFAS